jgi:hypothetical protein
MVKVDLTKPPEHLIASLDIASQAIKAIADLHGVCPVCLAYALADGIERAVEAGIIHHNGEDDAESPAPTHDAPRARQ